MKVGIADVNDPQVVELVQLHTAGMIENSPPDKSFALGVSDLKAPEINLYGAWSEGILMGIGALKTLSSNQGEIKSMRTHHNFLRRGVGANILERIILDAEKMGLKRLSLETGVGEVYQPALSLYRRYGFESGDAFGDYASAELGYSGDFNQFLHLDL